MEYSVFIQLSYKSNIEESSLDVQNYSYYNENHDEDIYEDILENVTDRYSSGRIENNFVSISIEENVYNAAKYLVEIPHNLIYITSISKGSDLIKDLFYKYIDEIIKEKKEKKLEKLFSEIDFFTKKYCTNNREHGKEEWIEIVLPATIISEINIKRIYKIPNEDGLDSSDYISIFYYKNSIGLIEASYESANGYILKKNLTLNSTINFEEMDDLDDAYYSLIFYKTSDILDFCISRFRNCAYFNEHALELQKTNDLILKIYKANKKFESVSLGF